MMISKRTFLIWSNIINFLSLFILLILAIIFKDSSYIMTGYLFTGVVVLVSVFIRIWYIDTNIFSGRLDSRFFKMSDDYKDYKFKNLYSFGLIALDIILALIISAII